MSREIKFRIWDKNKKEFINPYYAGVKCAINEGQQVLSSPMIFSNFGEACGDYVIQQFTGLLDINDQEIYEGDIFKRYDNEILIIKWGKIEYMGHQGFQFFRLDGSKYCFYGSMGNWDEKELVGNICENPELLTT